jgi:hypothetical protein
MISVLLVVVAALPVGVAPDLISELLPVMVTGMYVKSSPVSVVVDEPGELAPLPPLDSKQTADVVPAREQSKRPVLDGEVISQWF